MLHRAIETIATEHEGVDVVVHAGKAYDDSVEPWRTLVARFPHFFDSGQTAEVKTAGRRK